MIVYVQVCIDSTTGLAWLVGNGKVQIMVMKVDVVIAQLFHKVEKVCLQLFHLMCRCITIICGPGEYYIDTQIDREIDRG